MNQVSAGVRTGGQVLFKAMCRRAINHTSFPIQMTDGVGYDVMEHKSLPSAALLAKKSKYLETLS